METIKNRTLTINKVLEAPIELVWDAWTDAEHIVKWWAPKGMDIQVIEHDFKVGGKWKYSMPMPNGTTFISEGTYLEITKYEKIRTSADFKPMTEGVELQVSFEKEGGHTKFTFSVVHPTEEYCKQQEEMGFYNGWGSVLERLSTYLQSS